MYHLWYSCTISGMLTLRLNSASARNAIIAAGGFAAVAKASAIHRPHLYRMCRGKHQPINLPTLSRLMRATGKTSADELLAWVPMADD